MAKFIRAWDVDLGRNTALHLTERSGIENVGSELRLKLSSNFSVNESGELELSEVVSGVLPSEVMFTDGSKEFTAPITGVDAVSESHLTTLGQVQQLVSETITGDFSETLINLSGQEVIRGMIGYVEGVSGSFQLGLANSPTTAKAQYICSATESILDGASGSFQNPSMELDNIEDMVSGFGIGDLYLSTENAGMYTDVPPSVSGLTILPIGWKIKNDKMVFFPGEALDL